MPELTSVLAGLSLLPKRCSGRPKLLAAALDALSAQPGLSEDSVNVRDSLAERVLSWLAGLLTSCFTCRASCLPACEITGRHHDSLKPPWGCFSRGGS